LPQADEVTVVDGSVDVVGRFRIEKLGILGELGERRVAYEAVLAHRDERGHGIEVGMFAALTPASGCPETGVPVAGEAT
jgi:hypothetical protein